MRALSIFTFFAWCAFLASGQEVQPIATPIAIKNVEPQPVMSVHPIKAVMPINSTVPVKPIGHPAVSPVKKPPVRSQRPIATPKPYKPVPMPTMKAFNFTMPNHGSFTPGSASGASSGASSTGSGNSTASSSSSSSSSAGKSGSSASSSSSSSSTTGSGGSSAATSSSSSAASGTGGKTGAGSSATASSANGKTFASSFAWSSSITNSGEVDEKEAKNIYPPKRNETFKPPSCGLKIPPCDPKKVFRNLDGSCNNLEHPEWGVPNSTYSRLIPPRYADGIRTPRRGVDKSPLPGAREVRQTVFPTGQKENNLWNINAMYWGQFMAHDLSILKEPENKFDCCTPNGKYVSKRGRFCFPIKISVNDTHLGKYGIECMNFTRTVTDKDMGCSKGNNPAIQINCVTDWLDLSNVYGLSVEMSNELRSFKGGKLKTEERNGYTFAPTEKNLKDNCRCNLPGEKVCYKTGDSRSNQNPQLAILQIIYVREHNRIADELCKINPHWDDERLFQEARRILIAAYQRISYYEWLPIFLGHRNLLDEKIIYDESLPKFVNDYNKTVNPSILNEFAHSAYRFYHTHIAGMIRLMNSQRETTSTVSLSKMFNRPGIMEEGENMKKFTMGMLYQNLEETDEKCVKEVNEELFACGKEYGIDLRAADIQRDRDHALGYYNEYRKYFNLTVAKSFDDYGDLISIENIQLLKNLYKNYADVDLSVGGGLEALASQAQAGPVFLKIMNEQFLRTRTADRFWYENESSGFTLDQLAEIRKATVSALFCDSGDGLKEIPRIGFTLVFKGFNEITPCDKIVRMDLTKWKETPKYD